MRKSLSVLIVLCASAFAGTAFAQENWTEGPVWQCSAYRTKQGQFDNYMAYLRKNFVPTTAESKAQGLILDRQVFTQMPSTTDAWDVLICTLYASAAKALDYSADDDAKMKAIQAKHYSTQDKKKQDELAAPRLEMRDSLWTRMMREVNLRPM